MAAYSVGMDLPSCVVNSFNENLHIDLHFHKNDRMQFCHFEIHLMTKATKLNLLSTLYKTD